MSKKRTTDKIFNNKLFWAAASLLCAIILWVYVTSTEGASDTRVFDAVAVEYSNEDDLRAGKSLIVTEKDADTVSVTLTGPKRIVASLSNSDIKAVVDLSTVVQAGPYSMPYSLSYPSGVDKGQITLTRASKMNISIVVDELTSVLVPVKGIFEGSTAEGFKPVSSSDIEFNPVSVWISGPSSELDNVACALVKIQKEGLNNFINTDMTYTLVDENDNPIDIASSNITLTNETVNVTLDVLAMKTVPLKITVFPGGGATEANLKMTIEPSEVEIAGPAEVLEGIDSIELGQILLSKLEGADIRTYSITLPEEYLDEVEIVTNVSVATVSYEITGLRTTTLTITNFEYANVPKGYKASTTTKSLDVVVRGKDADISKITASDLRIVIDLADVDAQIYTSAKSIPVTIAIDGYPDVGVLGDSYSATVVLTAGDENEE